MPNFAYANQTNFRPFSYQEMLAPVLMATQAHQAVEEAYSELDSQANAIGSLANEANDPVTYQRYKSYEAALRTQADALAKNGLTPGSRQSLLDLRGRYAKDITPIQNAITRRRELADEQRKALLQNPTLMFQRDMNSMSYESSLDRFLENPDYDYGERYSGALLTQQVSQAAGNLAKELSNYGNGKRLDAYTKTFLQQHGFTRDQVLDAISNPNRAQSQPVLNAIVEQVMGSSGMASWADQPTMDKAYNYARQGLWSAIGQTNVQQYADYGARLAAQESMKRRAALSSDKKKNLRVPDVTSYYFKKDRKKIPDILDDRGKLKESPYSFGASSRQKLSSLLFKDGKFVKPEYMPYNSESNNAAAYYDTINDILLNAGFSQEAINNMDKKTVESNLQSIRDANLNDAIGRDVYRFALDSNATELLISRLKSRGLKVRKIKSMRGMEPQFGGEEKLEDEYSSGTTSDILYDPKANMSSLLYKGEYYELPKGMISNNFYSLMDSYSTPETKQTIKDAQEVQKALIDKYNKKGSLTKQEMLVLERANSVIDYWGTVFNDIGYNFVDYVGTRNLNNNSNRE